MIEQYRWILRDRLMKGNIRKKMLKSLNLLFIMDILILFLFLITVIWNTSIFSTIQKYY